MTGVFRRIVSGCLSLLVMIALSSCGSGASGTPGNAPGNPSVSNIQSTNRMSVSIGTDPGCTVINEPCVSVTICAPNSSVCQTIGGILLDTGSFGLRIFSSLVAVPLPDPDGLAECAYFGSGTAFGKVVLADVRMGSEPFVTVPVQLINASYSGQTASNNVCGASLDASPSGAGFNGILGVGLFAHDCGIYCSETSSNGYYYNCNGSSCSGASAPMSAQVQNPVHLLPVDNNGVEVSFPSVPELGSVSTGGTVTFGIGTESNNAPSGVTVYTADSSGDFSATLSGDATVYAGSFVDSGSNAYYFPDAYPSIFPVCSSYSPFYCPSGPEVQAVSISGANGNQMTYSLTVDPASQLFETANASFSTVAGEYTSGVDLGIPFFMGKTVYVGINGAYSPLAVGPFWAF